MQFTMQAELTEDEIVEAITSYVRTKVPMVSETDDLDIDFCNEDGSFTATVSMTPPDNALAPKPRRGRPRKTSKASGTSDKDKTAAEPSSEPEETETETKTETFVEDETPDAPPESEPETNPKPKSGKGAPLDFGAKKAANDASSAEADPKPTKTKAGGIFNLGS